MLLEDFHYELPPELIAQAPLAERDASRLLVLHKSTGRIEHRKFRDLPEYLNDHDILVFNRSKVVKARLVGQRDSGGKVEVFLLRRLDIGLYECLVRATANKKIGMKFHAGEIHGEVISSVPNSMMFLVRLKTLGDDLDAAIEKTGKIPLPPYITRDPVEADETRYQTVYAETRGSVAAPTAGLHFTPAVLEELQLKGVGQEFVTLHVGLGTFQPIKVDNIEDHKMHTEHFEISKELIKKCKTERESGHRVVAVGTTTVRTLESAARGYKDSTDLFLSPGAKFEWVDAMLTNFHQPKSSLVVMVSAFVGSRELLFSAYAEAIKHKYRFFSYGDAMLIV